MSEGETTRYRVETEFSASDHASPSLHKVEEQAKRTAEAVESLKEGLKMAAEAIGLHELIKKTAETFIGFNASVETAKIKLTAMVGANFHASWKRASDVAGEMYEKFEKFAEIAPVSAQESSQFAQTISASVLAAGGQIKDLTKIATEGSVAAKALGFDAQRGAMELNRMLAGQVGNRSLMGKMLIGTMGLTPAQWKQLTQAQRLQKTEGALGSDTMKDATGALRESFGGAVAMFKDKIEVALGKVGLPLFKAVTAEVRSWSEWIDKHPAKIAAISDSLTSGIKEAMSMLRDVGSFLYPMMREAMSIIGDVMHFVSEHREMITGVVKGLLIYKGISLGGSVVGAAGGAMGGIGKIFGELGKNLKEMKEAIGGGEGGGVTTLFKGLSGSILPLIGSAGQFALLGTAVYGLAKVFFGETHEEKVRKEHSAAIGLTAAGWMKDFKEREGLMKAKRDYGLTNESSYQGINKKLQELHGDRESLIQAGISEGLIRQEIDQGSGTRRLSLTTHGGAALETEDIKALSVALGEAFKEAAQAAAIEWEKRPDMPRTAAYYPGKHGSGVSGELGYIEEKYETGMEAKEEELKSKVPVNQTVNITINQVAAKDPDRWLADIDDMAGRLINRPRRTKSSLATKIGSGM